MDKHFLYTKVEKLDNLGPGEWIDEPDAVHFEYKGVKCRILRGLRGGHLCGYIQVAKNHPWYDMDFLKSEIECHGGLTYAEHEDGGFWIGFDCAHYGDYMPAMEKNINVYSSFKSDNPELFNQYPECSIWHPTYKNVEYCIAECEALVEKYLEAVEEKK